MNKLSLKILVIGVFAGLGYLYYALVGCASGACPLTSNPFVTTAYGALIGALVVSSLGKPRHKEDAKE